MKKSLSNLIKALIVFYFIFMKAVFDINGFPLANIDFVEKDVKALAGMNAPKVDYKLYGGLNPSGSVYDVVSLLKADKSVNDIQVLKTSCDQKIYKRSCKPQGEGKNFAKSDATRTEIARHLNKIYRTDKKKKEESIYGEFKIATGDMLIKAKPVVIHNVEFIINVEMTSNPGQIYFYPMNTIQYNRTFYPYIIRSIELIPLSNETNMTLLKKNRAKIIYDITKKYGAKSSDSVFTVADILTINPAIVNANNFRITYNNKKYASLLYEDLKNHKVRAQIERNSDDDGINKI